MALLLPIHQPTRSLATTVGSIVSKDTESLVSAVPGYLVVRPILETGLGPADLIRVNGSIGSLSTLNATDGPEYLILTFDSGLIELVVYETNSFAKKHSFQVSIVQAKQPEPHHVAVNAPKTAVIINMGTSIVYLKLQKEIRHFVQEFSDGLITSMAWVGSKLAILYKQPGPVQMIGIYKVTPTRVVQVKSQEFDDEGIKVLSWQDGALVIGTSTLLFLDQEGQTTPLRAFAEPLVSAALSGNYLLCVFQDGVLSRLDLSKSDPPLKSMALLEATSGIQILPLSETLLLVETLVSPCQVLKMPEGKNVQSWNNPGPISNLLQTVDQGGHSQFTTTGTEVLNSTAFVAKFAASPTSILAFDVDALTAIFNLGNKVLIGTNYDSTFAWTHDEGNVLHDLDKYEFFNLSCRTLAASSHVQVTCEGIFLKDKTIEIPLQVAAASSSKVIAAHEATLYIFNGEIEALKQEASGPIVAVATNGSIGAYATETNVFVLQDDQQTELPAGGMVSSLVVTDNVVVVVSTTGLVEIYDTATHATLFEYCINDRSPVATVCDGGILVTGPTSAALLANRKWGFTAIKLTGFPASHAAVYLHDTTVVNVNADGLQIVNIQTSEHLQTYSHYYPQTSLGEMVQVQEDRLAHVATVFGSSSEFLPCDMYLRIGYTPFQYQTRFFLGESFVADKILKIVWPKKQFQGFIVSAIALGDTDQETKSLVLLFDYSQQVLLDSVQLKAPVSDLSHVEIRENSPFFLVGITCHLQLWRIKSTDTGLKLQICRNVATVANAVAKVDNFCSYTFVADMIRTASVTQIDRAGRANDILTCKTVRWPISGAIISTEPVQALCGNAYGDLTLLEVDAMGPDEGKQFTATQELRFGQTVTSIIRPHEQQIGALKALQSPLLRSILPAAYLATSAGGIYAYCPIADPSLKQQFSELIGYMDQAYPALGDKRGDAEIFDASFLLRFLSAETKERQDALEALDVGAEWVDELQFAVNSILH